MKLTVGVVSYGMGNIGSVVNVLGKIGVNARMIVDPKEVEQADLLVLPGVGSFDNAMMRLESTGLAQALREWVDEDRPLLGICLGAQLMTRSSDEGVLPGFGWINAHTRCFDISGNANMSIPNMGWRPVIFRSDDPLADGLDDEAQFYFVHSYQMETADVENTLCYSWHGHWFSAGVRRGNLLGVQFHPEKSHSYGKAFLTNYFSRYSKG